MKKIKDHQYRTKQGSGTIDVNKSVTILEGQKWVAKQLACAQQLLAG